MIYTLVKITVPGTKSRKSYRSKFCYKTIINLVSSAFNKNYLHSMLDSSNGFQNQVEITRERSAHWHAS